VTGVQTCALPICSDVERKRLFKLAEFDRLPDAAYQPEVSAMTYSRLRQMAAIALAAGQSVLIDAAHLKAEERFAATALANHSGAHFTGFWLDAPTAVLSERVAKRSHDASDATPAIVAAQAKEPLGVVEWRRLDASGPLETLVHQALAAIQG
jgi:predicted kinase